MAQDPKPDPNVPIHPDTVPVPGEAGSQAIELLDRHRNTVMIVAVVAVLAICASLVLRELNRQKRSEAAQAFSTAAGERSIEKLDAVVTDYEGSASAGNALLTKAEVQLDQDKFEDAKTTLLTFVDKYGNHPRHAQGLYALGNLSQRTGDLEAAADYYDRALAADSAGDMGPLMLIRKGDLALAQADSLRAAGKTEEAEAKVEEALQQYEESITRPEFRSSPYIEIAEQRLDLAKVGDVPVVPAPPEPEPEPEPAPAPAETNPAPAKPAAEKPAEPKAETKPAPAKPAAEKPKAEQPDQPKPAAKPAPEAEAPAKPKAEEKPAAATDAPAEPKPATPAEEPAKDEAPEAAAPAPEPSEN